MSNVNHVFHCKYDLSAYIFPAFKHDKLVVATKQQVLLAHVDGLAAVLGHHQPVLVDGVGLLVLGVEDHAIVLELDNVLLVTVNRLQGKADLGIEVEIPNHPM